MQFSYKLIRASKRGISPSSYFSPFRTMNNSGNANKNLFERGIKGVSEHKLNLF
jgi:hypothetical protein